MAEHDWIPTSITLIVAVIVVAILATEVGRGVDPAYVYDEATFIIIGVVGVLVLWVLSPKGDEDYNATLFDSNRLAGNWWARGIALAVLLIAFVGGSLATGQHSFGPPIINPYDASKLITPGETFSTQGAFITSLRSSIYPGIGEELLGWVITTGLVLLFLYLLGLLFDDDDPWDNTALIVVSIILAAATWAFLFATAHALAYGLDSTAYWSAAAFGFFGELANQFTGAPVSILAHIAHNFFIVLGYSIAVSIGSYKVAGAIIGGKIMNKQGKAIIWIILVAAIIIAGGLYAFGAFGHQPLSLAPAMCAAWTPMGQACTLDTDCIPAGMMPDQGISVRCNAGQCQLQSTACAKVLS